MSTLGRDKNLKSEAAKDKPRDEHGHFIRDISDAVDKVANISHDGTDDEKLVKVEVHNPLSKIYRLLEQLRQQKAFAFTLKGSLGIAGVAVALSVFGLFGGSKILCDKGTQTHIGVIRVLKAIEPEASTFPFFGFIIDAWRGFSGTQTAYNRIILELEDTSTIALPRSRGIETQSYKDQLIYATGQYDSCSRILRLRDLELK